MSQLSIIIPVYKNQDSLGELVQQLKEMNKKTKTDFEVVFVVDGSPDQSYSVLTQLLPACGFRSQLLLLSRNFGSFAAIRAGLQAAVGPFFAVMAADLQESVELPFQFFERLKLGKADIVFGKRNRRSDPFFSALFSQLFWFLYRTSVQKEMPEGGLDVFGCNQVVRNQILILEESNTTLVGLLLWVGFQRDFVLYDRWARVHGKSAWSLKRKIRYLLDSCFAFSDLPIRLLSLVGLGGMGLAVLLGCVILFARLTGSIGVPGYSALASLILFFGGLNAFGLGILGEYLWRTFENTKKRPNFIVYKKQEYEGARKEGRP